MTRRHSLVWLCAPPGPEEANAWWREGLPFVVCRRREEDSLSLGFCATSGFGSAPRRIAFSSRPSKVSRTSRPPVLGEDVPSPAALSCEGVTFRVFGSRLWDHLAGPGFVREGSDLDLVADLDTPGHADAACEEIERMQAEVSMRIDVELSFPGAGEVHWREWKSRAPTVLLKSCDGVRIVPRLGLLDDGSPTLNAGRLQDLADAAVGALLAELHLYPKPGLVSPVDSGSHADMDLPLLRASAESLRDGFLELAHAGARRGSFERDLVPIGIETERRMLQVTGGVNTHRGAIFALGLLVAAAASAGEQSPDAVRRALCRWVPALRNHALRGGHRDGARREAADGFPNVFEWVLPRFRGCLEDGASEDDAAIESLFALIANLGDSNLLRRGGDDGAAFARDAAGRFLAEGGVRAPDWMIRARQIHRDFVSRNLSPGGAADLLAATVFLHHATTLPAGFTACSPDATQGSGQQTSS